jgi:hypothetical protein
MRMYSLSLFLRTLRPTVRMTARSLLGATLQVPSEGAPRDLEPGTDAPRCLRTGASRAMSSRRRGLRVSRSRSMRLETASPITLRRESR